MIRLRGSIRLFATRPVRNFDAKRKKSNPSACSFHDGQSHGNVTPLSHGMALIRYQTFQFNSSPALSTLAREVVIRA